MDGEKRRTLQSILLQFKQDAFVDFDVFPELARHFLLRGSRAFALEVANLY